jgi:heme-degrading monooxygenase HmoA
MYVRVWEYQVEIGKVDAFLSAYRADGTWAQLFERADGFIGTELFSDVDQADRFVTIDRWRDVASWETFLALWGDDYRALDQRLQGLAAGGHAVVKGAVPGA